MAKSSTRPAAASENQPAWDDETLVDPHSRPDKARRVQTMFDAIAPTYERVNRFASLGQDASWRRRAIEMADLRSDDVALDVCCGTGDMLRAMARHNPAPERLIGLDFSARMLGSGIYEGINPRPLLCRADALRLPLSDAAVSLITCAFGVRNFQNLDAGLREMRRVLQPGGRAVILEFAPPSNPLVRWVYRLYTCGVLPRLGAWLSNDRAGAYRYLPRSIESFATRHEFEQALHSAGFERVTTRAMNLGTVVIYRAE